jgi:Rrf2 family protein
MFKKETEYALRALVYICEQNLLNNRPGIIEIAEEIDAPAAFTGKILQRLVKTGILSSQRGKGGGFFFDKTQGRVLLKHIVLLTEGGKIFTACGFGLGNCSDDNPCPIHDRFVVVRNELENLFAGSTISDLISNK